VREIRMLRSTWRGLETWHGRDAVTLANRKGRANREHKHRPKPCGRRRGVRGGKGIDQGKREAVVCAPDSVPGKHVEWAAARTSRCEVG
jgi:hypothetical protein